MPCRHYSVFFNSTKGKAGPPSLLLAWCVGARTLGQPPPVVQRFVFKALFGKRDLHVPSSVPVFTPPPPATPLLNHDHDNPWRHPMPSVSLFLSAGLGAERFPPLPARQWRPRLVRRELKERMRQQGKIYAIFACRPVCLSLSLSLSTR